MLHEQRAHHHVLVVERARVLPIRADATDDGRQMDDDVRTMQVVEALDVLFVDEVELPAFRTDDDALGLRRHAGEDAAPRRTRETRRRR